MSENLEDLRMTIAGSIFDRMTGLLRKNVCQNGEVLMIMPCKSIHTIGMKEPIDVAFVDAQGTVQRSFEALGSGKLLSCRTAVCVLERRSMRRDDLLGSESYPKCAHQSKTWFAVGDSVAVNCFEDVSGEKPELDFWSEGNNYPTRLEVVRS